MPISALNAAFTSRLRFGCDDPNCGDPDHVIDVRGGGRRPRPTTPSCGKPGDDDKPMEVTMQPDQDKFEGRKRPRK